MRGKRPPTSCWEHGDEPRNGGLTEPADGGRRHTITVMSTISFSASVKDPAKGDTLFETAVDRGSHHPKEIAAAQQEFKSVCSTRGPGWTVSSADSSKKVASSQTFAGLRASERRNVFASDIPGFVVRRPTKETAALLGRQAEIVQSGQMALDSDGITTLGGIPIGARGVIVDAGPGTGGLWAHFRGHGWLLLDNRKCSLNWRSWRLVADDALAASGSRV